jgi:hypothetical protein
MSTNLEGAFGPACCLVLRDRHCPWAVSGASRRTLKTAQYGQSIELIDPCWPAARSTGMDGRTVKAVRTDHRQDTKGMRWMPWHQEPMKDVDGCDKPR